MATKSTTETTTCPLCDKETEELWYCKECMVKLCGICSQNIHTKIPANQYHNIHKINDEATVLSEHEKISDIQCTIHTEKTCFAICNHCIKCLCSECIQKPNEEIYTAKREKLKEIKERIDENLPFFQENIEELFQCRNKYEGKYNEIKEKILNHQDTMKNIITGQANRLIGELDKWWKPTKDTIEQEEKRLRNAENNLKKRKLIVEQALESNNTGKIIQAVDSVDSEIPSKKVKPEITQPNPIHFAKGTSEMSLVFGSLYPNPAIKIVQSQYLEVTDILLSVDENLILGYNKSSQELKHFVLTIDNQCFHAKSFNRKFNLWNRCVIRNIAVNSLKQILCSINIESIDHDVYLCLEENNQYQCQSLFSIKPLYPTAIHHDNKDRILVGYASSKDKILSKYSESGIMVYTDNKKKFGEIKLDRQKVKPFTFINDIKTNYNGDICVVDQYTPVEVGKTGKIAGRLLVLDKFGKFKWEYTGNGTSFQPNHVTTSPKGLIFVSDKKGNQVYMLSQNGILLTSLGESDGIIKPSVLTVYKENQLLIGCEGELHIVEIKD